MSESPEQLARRRAEVKHLRARRPRNWFGRASALLAVGLVVVSWLAGGFSSSDILSSRRLTNLRRFMTEVRPYPLQREDTGPSRASAVWEWARDLLAGKGLSAAWATLALSVAAIVLAGALALVLTLPAARNVASAEPFGLPGTRVVPAARWLWTGIVVLARGLLTFFRAIPEYVWAFLFLSMLGPQAWPAVLALAVHNGGILGRLGAEVVENVEPAVPRALRGLGAGRLQVAMLGVFPLVLPRLLLYFFYRWETCVREATVLGLLGFTSLGYWIDDARVRGRYDEMTFFVALAASIVLAGDVASAVTRRVIRNAA